MKRYVVTVLVVGLLLAADTKKNDAKKDQEAHQGTWRSVSFEMNGQKTPEDELKKRTVTYTGDKWEVKDDGKVVLAGTQKLDPAKDPHEIDSLITEGEGKGTTMLGIYELKGDTFRVCFDPTGKERPKTFTPKEGQFVGVVERKKK